MGNFAENLNLGNRFRPPWFLVCPAKCWLESEKCYQPFLQHIDKFLTTMLLSSSHLAKI